MGKAKLSLFYITSARKGLHAFTYKEISLLKERGLDVCLGLTKYSKGAFNPNSDWEFLAPGVVSFISGLFLIFLSKPKQFFKILKLGISQNSLIYLLTSISFYYQIRRKKMEFSIVHCQMGDHKLNIAYFLSILLNKPYTTTIHAHELYRVAEERFDNLKFLYNNCKQIFTISAYNKRLIEQKFQIDSDSISVIYLYPTNYNFDLNVKRKILIVANWFYKKGYDFLLKALKELKRDDYILWVVGDYTGDKTSVNVEKIVKEYGLIENITIFGPQPQSVVEVLMYSCDFFCLPSVTDYYPDGRVREKEGIPVAIMEAMSWGKPVISTKHAGISELVNNFLVEENDVHQLAETLNFLLDSHSEYPNYGEDNKKIVQSKFSEENVNTLIDSFLKIQT